METPTQSSLFNGASPKLTFIFGLAVGIAGTAILSLGLYFFVGTGTSGSKSTGTVSAAVVNNSNTGAAQTYGNVRAVDNTDYILGDKNAKVTLIEYSDLECPYCKTFHPTITSVLAGYNGKVNMVYRQFPLSFHQNGEKEAEAALCVGSLGGASKYYDFIDKVFQRTTSNGTGFALTALGPLAKEVGVNQQKFQDCVDKGTMAATVSAQENDGSQAGATGTPTTFIVKDGKTVTAIPGAYTADQVKALVDQALSS